MAKAPSDQVCASDSANHDYQAHKGIITMLQFSITLLILIISRPYFHYTGKPWFKKLIFDQIIFDWRKIYLKNRRPEKEVLCRWIGKLRSFLYQDFTLLAAFINQLTNSCCNHHIDGTSQSDTVYWKMKPRKRMKQKVWIIFIKCQPEALHNGKYDVEGVKYINTWKKSKEICNFPVV